MDYSASPIMTGFGRRSIQPAGTIAQYDGPVPVEDVRTMLFGWSAVPAPMFATINGRPVPVTSHVQNYRSDTLALLGTVGSDRAIHQYADALLDNVAAILGTGSNPLGIATAGLLRGGAQAYVSISLADTITTADGIEYLPNLLAYSSHDASLATEYRRSVVNIVCGNAMGHARHSKQGIETRVRVRHTRNSVLRLESAREALGILAQVADDFAAHTSELCSLAVSERDWDAIVDELCGPMPGADATARARTMNANRRDALNDMLTDSRVAPWRGTAWGAVQAVNTHAHHVQTVRGAHRDDRNLAATIAGDWDALDANTERVVRRVLAQR